MMRIRRILFSLTDIALLLVILEQIQMEIQWSLMSRSRGIRYFQGMSCEPFRQVQTAL